jgi:hypothetical protein
MTQEMGQILRIAEEQGRLVAWLREYPDFCPLTPALQECLAKFPLLDRERVLQSIQQVLQERAHEPKIIARAQAMIFFLRILGLGGPRVRRNEHRELSPDVRSELEQVGRIVADAYAENYSRAGRRKRGA